MASAGRVEHVVASQHGFAPSVVGWEEDWTFLRCMVDDWRMRIVGYWTDDDVENRVVRMAAGLADTVVLSSMRGIWDGDEDFPASDGPDCRRQPGWGGRIFLLVEPG